MVTPGQSGQLVSRLYVGGKLFSSRRLIQADALALSEEAFPAGQAGTITDGGGTGAGEITLASTPTVVQGDQVRITWADGHQYQAVVGVVDGNVVPVTAGVGGNLPVDTTPVVLAKEVALDLNVLTDSIKAIALDATADCGFILEDSDEAQLDIFPVDNQWVWEKAGPEAAYWFGEEAGYFYSAAESQAKLIVGSKTTAAGVATAAVLYDNEPE